MDNVSVYFLCDNTPIYQTRINSLPYMPRINEHIILQLDKALTKFTVKDIITDLSQNCVIISVQIYN